MTKVILVNPYNPSSDHIQPPLGLGYLATSLRRNNFDVKIFDANFLKLNEKEIIQKLVNENPDVVGFQLYTQNILFVKICIKGVKTFSKDIVTIVGGPHPSATKEKIFEEMGDNLDFSLMGEGEISLPNLVKTIYAKRKDFSSIGGLVYRKGKNILVNPLKFHANLDDFNPPAWDLVKPENYPEAQHGAFFQNFPISPIVITRGCPFGCNFCSGYLNSGKTLRKRSVNNVLSEIEYLNKERNIKEFHIIDDNFTLDKNFAKEILRGIIKLNLNVSFAVPNGIRLESLDEEILALMKRANFYLISVGIESGSDRVLKLMNKGLNTKIISEKLELISKSGLDSAGFFILGYPGETISEIQQTIKFSLNLGLLRANYFLFSPLPGTKIFSDLKKDGKILEEEVSFTETTYKSEIPKATLKKLQKKAFVEFYFKRPNILIKNISKIKNFNQLYFLAKRAFNWLS